jgi:hypothetical protein|tara:strand:+ start:436 stop:627 length:192 start_codon:yes stop_codon:yes gene_type:complete
MKDHRQEKKNGKVSKLAIAIRPYIPVNHDTKKRIMDAIKRLGIFIAGLSHIGLMEQRQLDKGV